MRISKYQVDAFADRAFEGNPAVVCPVPFFPAEHLMQAMAAEHNLSETAFIVREEDCYQIRWYTPEAEVELCGHATLASAYVVFEILGYHSEKLKFRTRYRGELFVEKQNGRYELDFPATKIRPSELSLESIQDCFDVKIKKHFDGKTDCLILLANEEDVMRAKADLAKLSSIERRGVMITSESNKYDFVSRFFAPGVGVSEDPVTGSAHTLLIPFWAERLGKTNLVARQVSRRGGTLFCKYMGERVLIGGGAVLYSVGEIDIEI